MSTSAHLDLTRAQCRCPYGNWSRSWSSRAQRWGLCPQKGLAPFGEVPPRSNQQETEESRQSRTEQGLFTRTALMRFIMTYRESGRVGTFTRTALMRFIMTYRVRQAEQGLFTRTALMRFIMTYRAEGTLRHFAFKSHKELMSLLNCCNN